MNYLNLVNNFTSCVNEIVLANFLWVEKKKKFKIVIV